MICQKCQGKLNKNHNSFYPTLSLSPSHSLEQRSFAVVSIQMQKLSVLHPRPVITSYSQICDVYAFKYGRKFYAEKCVNSHNFISCPVRGNLAVSTTFIIRTCLFVALFFLFISLTIALCISFIVYFMWCTVFFSVCSQISRNIFPFISI